ncbi:hypothetical protein [Actinoplanes auranticolor]|uniref:hypothetical protein n=1 Tax=Actinoplanes auranticolor TaxID=47988 RepID=UPI001BB36EB4|nr:hypothetical protein [Actinoplanes auranticolor]
MSVLGCLYRESDPGPVIRRLAEQLNVHHEALRNRIRQAEAEADAGERRCRGRQAQRHEAGVVATATDPG